MKIFYIMSKDLMLQSYIMLIPRKGKSFLILTVSGVQLVMYAIYICIYNPSHANCYPNTHVHVCPLSIITCPVVHINTMFTCDQEPLTNMHHHCFL